MRNSNLRVLLAFAMFAGVFSCASPPDDGRLTRIKDRPDENQFKTQNVSYFLERRCGTLDCHGQIARPLRIYGNDGLRLPNDAGLYPGKGGTSDAERSANYLSVLGLEPEQMNRVMAGEDPTILLIIEKPLAYDPDSKETIYGVRHRGGPQIIAGQDGYKCLYQWLKGTFDSSTSDACRRAGDALSIDQP
ncbi:MAG TPA: hypothetical protein VNO21_11780 [Polyangiaceae bacterium]|nr:hypothetical protein [Polyangiaceae bacterium]